MESISKYFQNFTPFTIYVNLTIYHLLKHRNTQFVPKIKRKRMKKRKQKKKEKKKNRTFRKCIKMKCILKGRIEMNQISFYIRYIVDSI